MPSITLTKDLVGTHRQTTDCVLYHWQVRLPFFAQAKPSGQALEKRHTEVPLQLTDLLADRTLSQVQLLRCMGEIQIPRRHFECPQPIQGW
jgi:hypothetical protein